MTASTYWSQPQYVNKERMEPISYQLFVTCNFVIFKETKPSPGHNELKFRPVLPEYSMSLKSILISSK